MGTSVPDRVSLSDLCGHFAGGALLGIFLALSLIVGNATIWSAISNATHPRLFVFLLLGCTAAFVGVGSAISGFIFTSLERNR